MGRRHERGWAQAYHLGERYLRRGPRHDLLLCPHRGRPAAKVVRGFITNHYTVFQGDYVCAIIDVTNMSTREFVSLPMSWQNFLVRDIPCTQSPNAYFASRGGGLEAHTVSGHSGFSFEALVRRDATNEATLCFLPPPRLVWPLAWLPVSIAQKLPPKLQDFVWSSQIPFKVCTEPFTMNGRLK